MSGDDANRGVQPYSSAPEVRPESCTLPESHVLADAALVAGVHTLAAGCSWQIVSRDGVQFAAIGRLVTHEFAVVLDAGQPPTVLPHDQVVKYLTAVRGPDGLDPAAVATADWEEEIAHKLTLAEIQDGQPRSFAQKRALAVAHGERLVAGWVMPAFSFHFEFAHLTNGEYVLVGRNGIDRVPAAEVRELLHRVIVDGGYYKIRTGLAGVPAMIDHELLRVDDPDGMGQNLSGETEPEPSHLDPRDPLGEAPGSRAPSLGPSSTPGGREI